VTIGIVGLGLIGGSIGLALRASRHKLIGCDPNPEHVRVALERGCVDVAAELSEVAKADVVFVAIPPAIVTNVLAEIEQSLGPNTVVTDCTSVKSEIVAWAAEQKTTWFVPGHPMAGHEKGGPQFASAWLFRNARWILTPVGKSTSNLKVLETLITEMGAKPVRISAEDHDRHVAILSHLPHVLAGQLVLNASKLSHVDAAGGSWKDWTRVAGVDPELWSQILLGNRTAVSTSLREFAKELETLATQLDEADAAAVKKFFVSAAAAKAKLPRNAGDDVTGAKKR
jgi:prephenate dehydrogenase